MIAAGIMDLLVLMPLALLVASRRQGTSGATALLAGLKGVGRNPLVLAIVTGLAFSLLRIPVPQPIDDFLRLLGSSAGPVALFAIGVFVYRPGPVRADGGSWLLVAMKLLVHPALAWLIATIVFGLDAATAGVITMVAALPAAGTAFLFVERHGGNVDRVASAILLSTALSFVTITLLTSWIGPAPG
jgi:predicted permease